MRQSNTPVTFQKSLRKDTAVLMSSGFAGRVQAVGYFPLMAGDSCSGKMGLDVMLKEMPKPLLNAVMANVQAWFVPKSALPQFGTAEDLTYSRSGALIKSLGSADRTPPPYFTTITGAGVTTIADSELYKALGIHLSAVADVNSELIDSFVAIYNFRLAAHSSRLPRRRYHSENLQEATSFPPAFWPSSRLSRVVPDYERALLVGALDLDVAAGRLPIVSDANVTLNPANTNQQVALAAGTNARRMHMWQTGIGQTVSNQIFAEMAGSKFNISLADLDKARTTQAFAKLRTAYAGNDISGFDNSDALIAMLMQGIPVPSDQMNRPILLDSKRVTVGLAERHATDGANMATSVTVGKASAMLSLNVPMTVTGGTVIFTVEVLPERIDERMSDEWMHCKFIEDIPNALRDVQRVEPVDQVMNRRVDAKHTSPYNLYGFEPMNDKWNRDFTRLGGDFYMATPGGGWTSNRSNIWQTELVNPTFSGSHYLAPYPFPQDVFALQTAHAYEVVCRHAVTINGLTQIGDVLMENNNDFLLTNVN